MIKEEIERFRKNRCCTLLGVGPMSLNCVDASIEISNKYNIPLFLISSRRQIDSEELGKGYVNNWSTSEFANYVKEKDKKLNLFIQRSWWSMAKSCRK